MRIFSRFVLKLFLVVLLYIIYASIALIVFCMLNKFPQYKYYITGTLKFNLKSILSYLFSFYIFIYVSLFNWISLTSILFYLRYRKNDTFNKYIIKSLAILLLSYLLVLLTFYIFGEIEFLRMNLPVFLGGSENIVFIGNIVITTILFYSWFLPLGYYKLSGWIRRKDKYN